MFYILINTFKNYLLNVMSQVIFTIINTIMLANQQSENNYNCFVLFDPQEILIIFKYIRHHFEHPIILIDLDILK